MALSAAELQKRHLEGAPDPFPTIVEASAKPRQPPKPVRLETDSESAFPSLSSASTPTPAVASALGPGSATWGPRIKATGNRAALLTESFTLYSMDLSNAGRDGKAATLGEVLKQITTKYKGVKIDASAQKGGQTTFYMRSESQKELDKAKRNLLALLSPQVTIVIDAPASTIATIIGPKGATLKQIRDQTTVRIDIPRKEDTVTNGKAHGSDDEEEERTVPVTVTGPQPLALEAQAMLNEIISAKTSNITQRVREIPMQVFPFIAIREGNWRMAAEGADIFFTWNAVDGEVVVNGDRSAVTRVVEIIKAGVEGFGKNITNLKMNLPKRQHLLLRSEDVREILLKTKCAVIIADPASSSEEVAVWGQPADLSNGVAAVMERANAEYIHEFPLPGPAPLSKQLLTYMTRIGYPKKLEADNHGVHVYTPPTGASLLNINIVGQKAAVDEVVRQVSVLIGKLIGATKEISIDWLLHNVIKGKNHKKIKQFHDVCNVQVFFPPESDEQSSILLVYDPFSASASPNPDDKTKQLDDVAKELLKMAKDYADVKSETISVEKRWHDAVIGSGGTTLNAIIGEDKTLSIKLGADASGDSEDLILIRGVNVDVDRAVREIRQIVENAKNDDIVNGFSADFEIEREYVGRVVGAQGAGVNRLRDLLGVKVDVSDESEEKDVFGGKKRKAVHPKTRITITGRKENVEEAKRRIQAQVERLADETSEVLKIPYQYHASLIGQHGKYAVRLEEKYDVKITFPRHATEGDGRTREVLKSDEVLIKGGKKGVANAKSELMDAVEFEKENNNIIKFTVPGRTVARILGRGGASINEIKDDTGVQVDIERNEGSDIAEIICRGTKKGIEAAKTAILAIAEQVAEETTDSITIESKFHRTLIGAGGSGLRDLILRCGGPSDPKVQAGLIRFPRQGENDDEVRLRGEPKLVAKIKAELEKVVADIRDRVVLGLDVPAFQHRVLIGRGGQHLTDLQNRTGAQIQFPGSRSYSSFGVPENADELKDVDPANLVRIHGTRAACERAIEEIKRSVKVAPPSAITETILVPFKYYHAVTQQNNIFRQLRTYGVHVEQSAQPSKPSICAPPSSDSSTARIDDAAEEASSCKWDVVENYQDVEEGESVWTLKARDQAGLDRAKTVIVDLIKNAEQMSHIGFLTLPDRSLFPRIVGTKGSNVARLRDESGADINVSKENNTIVITGTEAAIVAAKDAILKMAANPAGRHRRRF
ncbi:hypothetical protein FISHEDRAFT_51652 [Fistulina hepatica ATCC 64428]|uniref:K Homology domain-containing protein n=1 Tax=Fistulina hepatica ATCC 64428 TaxID=1128425 RepID=A0A0D7A096_9AGAR|nr:hypothetical protein FISHEDRAFT_51652 [Fistulina hepatica ATCC 64428]